MCSSALNTIFLNICNDRQTSEATMHRHRTQPPTSANICNDRQTSEVPMQRQSGSESFIHHVNFQSLRGSEPSSPMKIVTVSQANSLQVTVETPTDEGSGTTDKHETHPMRGCLQGGASNCGPRLTRPIWNSVASKERMRNFEPKHPLETTNDLK